MGAIPTAPTLYMILEKVLETTKYVVERSKEVNIKRERLGKIAEELKGQNLPPWQEKYYLSGSNKETVQYFFILDSLNFCFFADKNKKKWAIPPPTENRGEKEVSGYFALALALKRAANKYPLLDAEFLSTISFDNLKKIFQGEGDIPLLEERWAILKKTGTVLLRDFEGEAVNILKKAQGNAQKLVETLLNYFPSFRDVAEFENGKTPGKKIYFLKRAQIFVSSIYGAFSGKELGEFSDIHKLTCFADYKVPQVLVNFGLLEYSSGLLEKIETKESIPAFSREEMEIRANTIWAVEEIKKEMRAQGLNKTSLEIDWILWTLSKKIEMKIPHHCTRTIYY